MNNIAEFLSYLCSLDIKIRVEENRLRCSAPKDALTAAIKAELSDRKAEIIEFLRNIDTSNYTQNSIQPLPRTENLPLSFSQQRLWFIDQLGIGSHIYNILTAIRLKGLLNVVVLERTFNEIVRRHEVLRTTFTLEQGQPIQVIHPTFTLSLPVINLQKLPPHKQEAEVQRVVNQEASQRFNLTQGPLLRSTLLQLDEEEHVVMFTMHHTIADGWSMGVLMQEVAALYEAFSQSQASPLAELPIQYADFAVWQRQWLQGEVLKNQLTYWKQKLSGLSVLQLPTDHPRPAIQRFQGAKQSFSLSAELTKALKILSRNEDATLFMTLLATFQTLLHRYSGQDHIVVGSPIANRNCNEIEQLIGCFVNTLVLNTDFSDNPSFRELLGRVRQVTLAAYSHQDLPFDLLVEELQPQRDLSHTPLFQVMFVLQNAPISAMELSGLNLSVLENNSDTAMFDLTLYMEEKNDKLIATLEYNTDLFERDTIARMIGHLHTLLAGIVANPQLRLSELPLLTESEQHQLLREWNSTQIDYPQDKCIHQLFEVQVERSPNAIAVVFENQKLTYQQLNDKANQLAHHLCSMGVGPEVLVGICVERSLEMIIGLLGILKAGGAYVPLDPTYPQERLAFMLTDTNLLVLLTQQHLTQVIPANQAQVICLDTDNKAFASQNPESPVTGVKPEHLAYIIYTSGSTGTPKGVMSTHFGLCNRLLWMQDVYQLTPTDRVLQKTPFSFDVSVWEFFWPLLTGATLVLAQPEGHRDANYLAKLINQQQITTLHFVPSMLQAFLETPELDNCQSLRRVICSGEALSFDLEQRFFEHFDTQFYNLYGPTEASIDVTAWQCQQGKDEKIVPIGRPIANIQIYILDKYLQPVPIGVKGELHIGGVGLARGYLNRPELTKEKFISSPFETGKRLYKTGDLARYRLDGNIEYLGRIDHQVKIRGFRIELGEIEALITQHRDVRETVVTVRSDRVDTQRLVAYMVPYGGKTLTITDLRHFLASKLPNYMIPGSFIILEALPLTLNGKVDHRALPAPDQIRPELEKAFIAPQTTVEKQLADIWAQVLGLEKIGIKDNFFELGGDSILSIQLVSQASQAGLHLTAKQLFQHQTIAELAAVCNTSEKMPAEQGIVMGAVPLIPIQQWFFEQNLLDAHHFNQSVLLEIQRTLDTELLKQAVQELLRHHDALRLRFEQVKSGWQQFHAQPDDTVPFSFIDLSRLPPDEQKSMLEMAIAELQASLNLTEGPLIRVAFFDLGAEKTSRLLLTIHHLVVDGVSWRILIDHLETVYGQLSRGEAINLPAKTTSFKEWSQRIQQYSHQTVPQQELNYWLTTLQKPINLLPVDYPEGSNTLTSARSISTMLSVEETKVLLQDVPTAYRAQINDVLLTALVQAFLQWTGEGLLLINLEGHGREDIFDDVDLSRTIGWFTSMFPVLLDVKETSNLGKAIGAVKEQLRAIPNRGIGYGLLRYLNENIEIRQSFPTLPQPQVVFNYLGQFDQTVSDSSLFALAQETCGGERSLQNNRSELLDINSFVTNGRLQVDWTYSEKIHRESTIASVAQEFVKALRSLIIHYKSPEAGGYIPSDFPTAKKLNQQQLDHLLQKYQQIEDIYPLSSMQEGMLFHTLYNQNSEAYFFQTSCILQNLNLAAFKQAWQQVIERHVILRTAFFWEGLDTPLQVILKHVDLPYQLQDWRGLAQGEQQARLDVLLKTDRHQGFNITTAPLMRLILIQLADHTYQFIWSNHHLLLDGWSVPLLLKEVFSFYKAFCQNQNIQIKMSRPYRDYIAWLQQQDISKAEAFWRQTLTGISTPTLLPLNHNSEKLPNQQQNHYEQEIKLSIAATAALESLVRQHQLTLNTVFQGVWALLLSYHSGEADVVFGATVSGRPPTLVEAESMIGLFINTMPVRVSVSAKEFFLSWLKQIQDSQVEARQYEYSPLVKIQEWSEIPRKLPLFNSIVVFDNYPVDAWLQQENIDLQIQNIFSFSRNHYPLTLRVVPGLELSLQIMWVSEISSHYLNSTAIARMTQHLKILLCEIGKNPQIQIQKLLEILAATDREQQVIQKEELKATELQKLKITKRKTIRNI